MLQRKTGRGRKKEGVLFNAIITNYRERWGWGEKEEERDMCILVFLSLFYIIIKLFLTHLYVLQSVCQLCFEFLTST